jgi:CBS domain-containing protein
MQVSAIMTRDVASCRETDTLAEAVRLMADRDCGSLPVIAGPASRRVVGIVTDRDICLTSYRLGKPLTDLCVRDAMTQPVRTCSPEASASEAEYVMRDARVRRLPVVDDQGQLVGIVSLTDLAREAQHERRLQRPDVTRLDVGVTLAEICTPPRG